MHLKHRVPVLLTLIFALFNSTGLVAAGKCAAIRSESTFELINAPVEEMLNSRNSSAIDCVYLKDFIARSRASKPGMIAEPSRSAPTTSNGAYVPKTKDDNTPWRFDMNQNGKRMTSVEFDAWMKAKGIRVATGKPSADAAPVASTVECKPTKDQKC
jgi:hypothetical protein